jgi:hypothetical protein
MKDHEPDHTQEILEIRSMMEHSTKFVWISGWAGIIAGLFALTGAYIAYAVLEYNPNAIHYQPPKGIQPVLVLGLIIFILAALSATLLAYNQARYSHEKLWNATSKRLLLNMTVPLIAGGILIFIAIAKNMAGLITSLSLLFYGLALHNASKYTYEEIRIMGLVQILLGLAAAWFIPYALLIWTMGFGAVHIIYGVYIQCRYK